MDLLLLQIINNFQLIIAECMMIIVFLQALWTPKTSKS